MSKTTVSKFYLSGPMTGYVNHNFSAFDAARDRLTALGFEVVSPADLDRQLGFPQDGSYTPEHLTLDVLLKRDLEAVFECDALYMLTGWKESKGANLERDLALLLNKPIVYEDSLR